MQTATDPTTGKKVKSYKIISNKELHKTIDAADNAFRSWSQTELEERARLLREVARILGEEQDALAMLITREMGKLLKDAKAEVEKCAWACLYYAQNAERFLRDEYIATEASKSYISYRPLGVILAVMPWNFPFWQVFRFAAPNLMAGNTILLKHAPNVPGCALAIAEIIEKAGFPKGAFSTILIDEKRVKKVIKSRAVKGVTLTGSVGAGRAVAGMAGKALKKTVLELGGSDPYLILDDADVIKAAQVCAKARLLNNGQSCIGAKRFIVMPQVYDQFLEAFKAQMEEAVMGDPLEEETLLAL
jgi:succinate-semialdehyde dehydrogenase/glutarate-semialdehyde dehydrogenase